MIAIIPARGGSKGLPGKNIKPLNGKPLIAYSIEAALGAQEIERVIVSTDNEETAKIAVQFGAEVPFMRPAELAQDNSKAIDVYLDTIEKLENREHIQINSIVVLLPTAPLRTSKDIDEAISLYNMKGADSVVSYTEEQHPISWHKYIDENNRLTNIFEDNLSNRQELKKTYYPNGSIYVFKTQLLKSGKYYSDNSYAFLMPRSRSVDIDTQDDFTYAEFLMKMNL